ncbi:hypothetical protein NQZ68_025745, partial [Dissostichus eleginoides]
IQHIGTSSPDGHGDRSQPKLTVSQPTHYQTVSQQQPTCPAAQQAHFGCQLFFRLGNGSHRHDHGQSLMLLGSRHMCPTQK